MSRASRPRTPPWWFDGSPVPLWARILTPLYAAATALRRFCYRHGLRKRTHPGVPVVVVGNLLHFPIVVTVLGGGLVCFGLRVMAIRRQWQLPVANERKAEAPPGER